MYVKCGAQTRTRHVSISSEVAAVGEELRKCPVGMYAFIVCDTVSAFARREKIRALRLVKQQTPCQENVKQLGMKWVLSDMLFQSLQEYTCKLY